MIFEFRFYSVAQSRITAEIARIYDVAIAGAPAEKGGPPAYEESLWDRYSIPRPIGAWTVSAGPQTPGLMFILPWDSLKHREQGYPRFWNDPYWLTIRAKGADGSPLVESIEDWILGPSSVWPRLWDKDSSPVGPVQELIVQHAPTGAQKTVTDSMATVDLPIAQSHGARVLGVFEVAFGPNRPSYLTFLAWPSFEAQQKAREAMDHDSRILDQRAKEIASFGRPVFPIPQRYVLDPISTWGHPAPNFGLAAENVQPLVHHGGSVAANQGAPAIAGR